ncbi:MAG: DUF2383 domain-containing protein [Cellvibrio sp.]|uniref:DUF2383 domain-containing protein n=1 Tax=Cellvibrio sp. TaxID=1965322 RepID=UPI0031B52D02
MFHLLSDTEVALNEILVACRESVDHYEDAIQLVENPAVTERFQQIAAQRKLFFKRLSVAIRELGDLPSVPDPDKETGEMILHHLGAAFTPDYTNEVLAQRIEREQQLLELIRNARDTDANENCRTLLDDLSTQVTDAIHLLSSTK